MSSIEKLKNIEILRFLFSLCIIWEHMHGGILKSFIHNIPLYEKLITTRYAFMAVDFFFIIAGFFLFLTTDFRQKFTDFAIKKIKRLMPVVFYSIFLYWIISLFTPIKFLKYENVFSLLNISNCGITLQYGNNFCTWFVSALFWTMCFYFYLYKIINKKMFNLICACLIFFCYAFWIHSSGSNFDNVYSGLNRGMLRAFAGLGVGYFIANLYKENIEKIKFIEFKFPVTIIITFTEIYLFSFIFKYTCLQKMNYNNPMILIIAFIGLFLLFIFKKGYLSKLLNNNLSIFLGQFAYSIFMTHFVIKDLWLNIVYKNCQNWVILHPYANLICLYTVIIIFGIITYYLIEKPAAKLLKNFSLKNMIKTQTITNQ